MRNEFGKGLFIKNDINGFPCNIGDTIRVTRPDLSFETGEDSHIDIDEKSWIGILCLLKTRGIRIRTYSLSPKGKRITEYIKPNLTNLGYNIWKWELIKSEL